jgi:hypothetical protein
MRRPLMRHHSFPIQLAHSFLQCVMHRLGIFNTLVEDVADHTLSPYLGYRLLFVHIFRHVPASSPALSLVDGLHYYNNSLQITLVKKY